MIYNIQVSRIMIPKMKDPVTQMHWAQQVILYETCCSGRVQQKFPSCFHCNNLGGDCHPGWGIDPAYDHLKRHVKWTFEVLSCSDWCSTPPHLVAHLLRENGHLKSSWKLLKISFSPVILPISTKKPSKYLVHPNNWVQSPSIELT